MLINFVGLKEPGNYFKRKIAEKFNCPIFAFSDATDILQPALFNLYGVKPGLTQKTKEEMKVMLRNNITAVHEKFYADWLYNKLCKETFKSGENPAKTLQGIVLDVVTPWEYRVMRTFLITNKKNFYGAPEKRNRFVLIDNEDLLGTYYNENYNDFLDFEVDSTVSSEETDEEINEKIEAMIKSWGLV